jgi:calcineurin-like phosphoesterase family protein
VKVPQLSPDTLSGAGPGSPLIGSAIVVSALAALVMVGSCGRTTRSISPDPGGPERRGESALRNYHADKPHPPHPSPGPGPSPSPGPGPGPGDSSLVFVGAGDIAGSGSGDEATAELLDQIPGTVFTAGDNVYPDGTSSEYTQYYEPTWGRFKARTRPAPGNHDYNTSGATGYYNYFGSSAGPAGRGYYSYNIGDWHIISLNSNIDMSAGSPQEQWLRADLAASPKHCTLAYWHHPRFSSGTHGSSVKSQAIWQALYEAGAEIAIVAHDHNYQRFAPQTADGQLDTQRGIREFVAGTGGNGHYSFSRPIANTEAYNYDTYGVLKLVLSPGAYSWEFIPVTGGTYHDAGSGTCH